MTVMLFIIIFLREKLTMSTPLDTKIISKLAEILDKTNLTELEYEDEGCRICLTRNPAGQVVAAPLPPVPAPLPVPPAAAPAAPIPTAAPAAPAPELDPAQNPNAIKSPMVGVVYLSPEPNAPQYVKVGDTIEAGATVCLIEAMKTFNPVKAPKGGKVTKILVAGGDPVEYGEPLIIVE